jgi:hypothetical protein
MPKSTIARRKRRRKNAAASTKAATELATSVGAGFAGYAATKLIGRMAYSQIIKKFPKFAKHGGVLASAAGAAAAYLGSKHWDKVAEHHDAITIGAGIAVLQSAARTYAPKKYAWIVSDYSEDQYKSKGKVTIAPPEEDFTAPVLPDAPEAISDFDLDRLLAENTELEAVPIGQAPPVIEDKEPGTLYAADNDATSDDLEHYNGMLN